jgi:hypothetical protein
MEGALQHRGPDDKLAEVAGNPRNLSVSVNVSPRCVPFTERRRRRRRTFM